jgi:hypothetical protein
MQFLKEIRAHLQDFETEVSDELHRFIDYLHTKYPEVKDAVVQPPAPLVTAPEATFVAPVLDTVEQPVETENVTNSDTPVSADPAPVVDTPVVDPTPAPQPDPEPAPSKE